MNINFENPAIKFYFSFQCPYSYLAFELLRQVLKGQKAAVMPIEIGCNELGAADSRLTSFNSEGRFKKLIKEAAEYGVNIIRPQSITPSLAAAAAIQEYGQADAEEFILSVFKAIFCDNIDVSSVAALRLHLQSDGLDSSILLKTSTNNDLLQKAKEQTKLWAKRRIRTVPTIEVDSERYAGYINKLGLERFLRSVIE